MKKNNKKGFTLAELLIVVAIIAVLTAIAIPVFTAQLEKSRESTDIANVRSAYATLMTEYLVNTDSPQTMTVSARQTQDGWQGPQGTIVTMVSGSEVPVPYSAKLDNYTVSIAANGTVTVK